MGTTPYLLSISLSLATGDENDKNLISLLNNTCYTVKWYYKVADKKISMYTTIQQHAVIED